MDLCLQKESKWKDADEEGVGSCNRNKVPRKVKVYSLLREERGEVCEFIEKQLMKGYIQPLKLPQIALVFFAEKKDSKK